MVKSLYSLTLIISVRFNHCKSNVNSRHHLATLSYNLVFCACKVSLIYIFESNTSFSNYYTGLMMSLLNKTIQLLFDVSVPRRAVFLSCQNQLIAVTWH